MAYCFNYFHILATTVAEDYGYSGYISDLNYEVTGNTVYLHFDYKNGKDSFFNCINAVNSKVNSIVSQIITPGISDFDKELAIHNRVAKNVKYNYNRLQNNTLTVDDFTAYGALLLLMEYLFARDI